MLTNVKVKEGKIGNKMYFDPSRIKIKRNMVYVILLKNKPNFG
jgi:hypothetical protein